MLYTYTLLIAWWCFRVDGFLRGLLFIFTQKLGSSPVHKEESWGLAKKWLAIGCYISFSNPGPLTPSQILCFHTLLMGAGTSQMESSRGTGVLSGAVTAPCAAPATVEQRLLGALSAEELWLQQDPVSRSFQTSQATPKPLFQYLNCFLCLHKCPTFCLSISSPSPWSCLRKCVTDSRWNELDNQIHRRSCSKRTERSSISVGLHDCMPSQCF